MRIRVGSRDSLLAVRQAELLMEAVRTACPEAVLELVTLKTTGDKILDRTLDQIGGKGLFVKELDEALRDGRADVTVHSCKDLPMEIPEDLPLAAFSKREDPRDALVLPEGASGIDFTRPIGCASLRRGMQVKALYPQCTVAPVRGNVLTRLKKLEEGQFSALILAAAGLKRLGLEGRIARLFTPEEMLPAAGQGVLAAQVRAGMDTDYLRCFHDGEAGACVTAERAFVRALDGGCSSPVAAFAVVEGTKMTLTGMNAVGRKDTLSGGVDQAEALGLALAERLR
ncbi:MAG: hydroxymethylbilane synthase [Oscillospiraceae bacterium]|jgi:hydroxymethylbilane synthase|nr:hydroxymethylbilane synthase [Oscillospiraceae bacterium]